MSYVQQNLLDGEKVIYQAKLHWMIFVAPAIAILFSLSLIAGGPISAGIGKFFLVISLIQALVAFLTQKTSEFAITNKRVIIKVGIIRRRSLENLLSKIEGVEVNQGIIGRMLNYGNIKVAGTGGSKTPFRFIGAPLEFRKQVQMRLSD